MQTNLYNFQIHIINMQKEYFITNSSGKCKMYSKVDNLNKRINSLLKKTE